MSVAGREGGGGVWRYGDASVRSSVPTPYLLAVTGTPPPGQRRGEVVTSGSLSIMMSDSSHSNSAPSEYIPSPCSSGPGSSDAGDDDYADSISSPEASDATSMSDDDDSLLGAAGGAEAAPPPLEQPLFQKPRAIMFPPENMIYMIAACMEADPRPGFTRGQKYDPQPSTPWIMDFDQLVTFVEKLPWSSRIRQELAGKLGLTSPNGVPVLREDVVCDSCGHSNPARFVILASSESEVEMVMLIAVGTTCAFYDTNRGRKCGKSLLLGVPNGIPLEAVNDKGIAFVQHDQVMPLQSWWKLQEPKWSGAPLAVWRSERMTPSDGFQTAPMGPHPMRHHYKFEEHETPEETLDTFMGATFPALPDFIGYYVRSVAVYSHSFLDMVDAVKSAWGDVEWRFPPLSQESVRRHGVLLADRDLRVGLQCKTRIVPETSLLQVTESNLGFLSNQGFMGADYSPPQTGAFYPVAVVPLEAVLPGQPYPARVAVTIYTPSSRKFFSTASDAVLLQGALFMSSRPNRSGGDFLKAVAHAENGSP